MKVLGHLFKNVTVKIYALLQASGLKAHVSVAGTSHRDWTGNSLDFRRKCRKRKFREQKSQSIESGKVHDEAKKVEDQVTEGPESKAEKGPRVTFAFQTDSSVSGIWKKQRGETQAGR